MPPAEEKKPELVSVSEATMTELVSAVLNDVLYNIISDTVMKVHRDEKLLRMQSAAIQAQQAAEKGNTEEIKSDGTQSITKPGAVIAEDGKIYLQGNPLATTTTITCPNCRLPRLLSYPADPKTEYCAKRPYHWTSNHDSHDIHGNPFPNDKPTKSKAAKDTSNVNSTTNKKAATAATPPSSSPPSSNSPPNENAKDTKSTPVPSFPTTKCPNCPRYLIITRIAQHLEKCMGIAGRQSSRNAMARISTDTPKDSRAGTPRPGKTVGAGNKVGDREKTAGDKAGVGKTVKVGEKEKPKKRKLKAEDEDGEEETPKKKNKGLLKKRGAEKTLPPKRDGGMEKMAKGDGGMEKTGKGDGGVEKMAKGDAEIEKGRKGDGGEKKMAKGDGGKEKSANGDRGVEKMAKGDAGIEKGKKGDGGEKKMAKGDGGKEKSANGDGGVEKMAKADGRLEEIAKVGNGETKVGEKKEEEKGSRET